MAGQVEQTSAMQLDHREHEGEGGEVEGRWRGSLYRTRSEVQPLEGAPEPCQAQTVSETPQCSVANGNLIYCA